LADNVLAAWQLLRTMLSMQPPQLPPGQQLVAPGKWPTVGERGPRPDDAPWSVEVIGAADRPCVFTLAQFHQMPRVEQTIDIHCVTRWSKLGVRFSGVSLATLLEQAQPDPAP
jgi:DMSO/TMAO reductase YedYZ molybdopterin-dependent catalytic subunit